MSMLLAIDVGNTNVTFGAHDGQGWVGHWRVRTVHDKMPDEYAVLFRDLLSSGGVEPRSIGAAVVSSVVPALTGRIAEMVGKLSGCRALVVGPGVKTGIRIKTDIPSQVGADLVCNAVAAHRRFGRNCVVVDFGTALSFTAVSAAGDLEGVAIAPGINTAAASLSRNTAQLPQVPLEAPPKAIGKNTTLSIQAGIVFGYVGLIEKIVDMMRAELGGEAIVIATGGTSGVIAPHTDRFSLIEPWLILEGLRAIAEMNA
jgi:type III pantothenate kinase